MRFIADRAEKHTKEMSDTQSRTFYPFRKHCCAAEPSGLASEETPQHDTTVRYVTAKCDVRCIEPWVPFLVTIGAVSSQTTNAHPISPVAPRRSS